MKIAAQCPATRGGVVDRRSMVVVGGYHCTRRTGHKGKHRDSVRGHEWAR